MADASPSPKRLRDLAIEAAARRIIQCVAPHAGEAEIQKRSRILVFAGSYTITWDEKPIMHIVLETASGFRMTIL